jgi:hypothetical protein
MTIDPDLTVSELLAAWRLGEREQVLDILAGDHPGLAALFLSQVAREIGLGLTAFNTAVNGLIDRRVEAVKKQDRNAEFLPVVLHRVLVQSGWTPPQPAARPKAGKPVAGDAVMAVAHLKAIGPPEDLSEDACQQWQQVFADCQDADFRSPK